MRAKPLRPTWILLLAALAGAAAGGAPEPRVLLRADLFAREDPDILYAIGNVRLERGDAVITADGAVVWTADREAYLEGHVVYRMGKSSVQAERAYIHWTAEKEGKEGTTVDRAFIFRGDVRWEERPDGVPWHIKAEEVLQVDVRHFVARGRVALSPCDFHLAHAFFQAKEVELVADEKFIATDISYHTRGVSLPTLWVPPIYWPRLYVPLGWQWPRMALSTGHSSEFGTFVLSEVTYELPDGTIPGVDAEVGLRLDHYTGRGLGTGGLFRYELQEERRTGPLGRDLLRGELDTYWIYHDTGEDLKDRELGQDNRWRAKFFHSQDIPKGFEFDVEYQRWSDAGFRREFFRDEHEEDKPVESRVYLKWSEGPFAAYFHTRWREDDWLDTTEYLPQVGFNVFSYPLWRNLLYTGHIEIANVHRELSVLRLPPGLSRRDPLYDALLRRRLRRNFYLAPLVSTDQEVASDDRRFWRFNTYHELSMPFSVSIFEIEPFVATRQTYYQETLDDDDGAWRGMFVYGARVATQFWRSWDDVRADSLRLFGVKIMPLEVDGLRHVVTPELRVMSIEEPTLGLDKLILTDDTDMNQPIANFGYDRLPRPYHPYDPTGLAFGDVDAIVPVTLVNIGLRNRWQTRRGGEVVDLIDLDADIDLYFHEGRDNGGENFSDLRIDFRFQPVGGIYFFTDFDYRVVGDSLLAANDFQVFNVGLALARSTRWQLFLSQRYEKDEMNRLGIRLVYYLSEKWSFLIQYQFNATGYTSDNFSLRLTRDLHDWIAEFVVEKERHEFLAEEEVDEETDNSVGFRLQPKLQRELIRGIQYTRDLSAGLDSYRREITEFVDY